MKLNFQTVITLLYIYVNAYECLTPVFNTQYLYFVYVYMPHKMGIFHKKPFHIDTAAASSSNKLITGTLEQSRVLLMLWGTPVLFLL